MADVKKIPESQVSWSEVPGNGLTNVALSAVCNGSALYLFMKGLDQKIYLNSTKDGMNWSSWSEVPGGGQTDVALAAVWAAPSQGGILTGPSIDLFSKGIRDHGVYWNSFDGINWSGWSKVPGGGQTDAALAGAVYGGPEFLFMKGLDQKIYVIGGSGFGGGGEVPGNGRTDTNVTTVYAGVGLYLFMKGLDQKIYVNEKPSGEENWGSWSEVPGNGQTDVAPAVVAEPYGGPGMYLLAKGVQDKGIYINSTKDGFNWTGWSRIAKAGTTDVALTATYFLGSVYLFWKGLDQRIYSQILS